MQAREITVNVELKPKFKYLIIGCGKPCPRNFKHDGKNFYTLDMNKEVSPDLVGDIYSSETQNYLATNQYELVTTEFAPQINLNSNFDQLIDEYFAKITHEKGLLLLHTNERWKRPTVVEKFQHAYYFYMDSNSEELRKHAFVVLTKSLHLSDVLKNKDIYNYFTDLLIRQAEHKNEAFEYKIRTSDGNNYGELLKTLNKNKIGSIKLQQNLNILYPQIVLSSDPDCEKNKELIKNIRIKWNFITQEKGPGIPFMQNLLDIKLEEKKDKSEDEQPHKKTKL